MASIRCKMLIRAEVEKSGWQIVSVELGEIEINKNIIIEKQKQLTLGEVIDNNDTIIFSERLPIERPAAVIMNE